MWTRNIKRHKYKNGYPLYHTRLRKNLVRVIFVVRVIFGFRLGLGVWTLWFLYTKVSWQNHLLDAPIQLGLTLVLLQVLTFSGRPSIGDQYTWSTWRRRGYPPVYLGYPTIYRPCKPRPLQPSEPAPTRPFPSLNTSHQTWSTLCGVVNRKP